MSTATTPTINDKAKQAITRATGATGVVKTMVGMKSNQVKDFLLLFKDQISQSLPKHLTAERIIQTATTLIARTPQLAECSAESLIGALMQAATLGFEPVPILGLCYFVPFNSKVKDSSGKDTGSWRKEVAFILGYKGMLRLARNSGEILTIYAQCVYERDVFEYEFGLEPKIKHIPSTASDRGKLTFAYAVAKFKGGGNAFEVMSKSDIDKIRETSKAKTSSFWSDWYGEMAKKTVLRRLSDFLPMSVEQSSTISTDGAVINIADFKEGSVDLNKVEQVEMTETNEPEPQIVDATTGEVFTPSTNPELFPKTNA